MRHLYSALFLLLLPLIVLRMLWRSRRAPAYRQRLGERLGFVSLPDARSAAAPLLWIHAVSLGETIAARPLIERLLKRRPGWRVLVTTTTPTGSAQLRKLFGERVLHVYAPWDTPGAVARFLGRVRPDLLVLMETELWPNMIHGCREIGCAVVLANARLSERSARGYARLGGLTRAMLGGLDRVAAQAEADARRFQDLGLDPQRVTVCGSIKFDVRLDAELQRGAAQLQERWHLEERPVCLVASTHRGEDALALKLLARLRRDHPHALLILAPRHPERFDEVATLITNAGYVLRRRSADDEVEGDTDVVLVDTLGELLLLFGVADLAVIGGSFIPNGGHNPLEAALWGIPVLTGPSMFNFAQVSAGLEAAGALQRAADAEALGALAAALLADPEDAKRRGDAGLAVVEQNRGALDSILGVVEGEMTRAEASRHAVKSAE
ncbi:MAG: lipid IV(A) 3-deoxy-D-manno-octulosonic acid transferase [Pseudomonadota bacterium]